MTLVSGEEDSLKLTEIQTLEGHTDRVWGLAWNPATGSDGVSAVLASCSGDKTVRIWQQTTPTSFNCTTVPEDGHTRTIRSCAWSPSGKQLATASFDAITGIWEQNVGDFECVSTLKSHENEVKSVSWNASGTLLATCSRDKCVWIWEVLPGNDFDCVDVLQGHTQDVKMVQWHPTVELLFSCSYDNTIQVWAEDGESDDEANSGHSSTVWAISFNSTGDKMVTCSDDLTVKVWGVDIVRLQSGDGNPLWFHVYNGLKNVISICLPKAGVISIFDRPNFTQLYREGIIATGAADDAICLFGESKDHSSNRLLASASDDGTIKIWKLE